MPLKLIRPTEEYAAQLMEYRAEMLANGDKLEGCAGLEDTQSFEEWIKIEERLKEAYGAAYVPTEVFLAVREEDNRLIGISDYRHPLNDMLLQFGGNIGYSIRPCERRKGFAKEMLALMLDVCRQYGETRVLITCDKFNYGSQKTIRANGGILENEVPDGSCRSASGFVRRYWIEL